MRDWMMRTVCLHCGGRVIDTDYRVIPHGGGKRELHNRCADAWRELERRRCACGRVSDGGLCADCRVRTAWRAAFA